MNETVDFVYFEMHENYFAGLLLDKLRQISLWNKFTQTNIVLKGIT